MGKDQVFVNEWLRLRSTSTVMAVRDQAVVGKKGLKVPMETSRGKAGGLNFVTNYLYLYHLAEEDLDFPDTRTALFSIADARHQYQPEFMEACMPYFFKETPKKTEDNQVEFELDREVAFTQVPQNFPEIDDSTDFLDNNNAMY